VAEEGAAARTAAVIARIVDEPVPIAERARRILQVLDPVFRCEAASIALRDPERQIRIPQASVGDAAALHAYWSSAGADAELARLGEPTRAAAAVHRPIPARRRDGVLAPLPDAGRLPPRYRRRRVHR
jgi:hypothetical protein